MQGATIKTNNELVFLENLPLSWRRIEQGKYRRRE